MARIKIEDLPKDMKISKKEMQKITGGAGAEFTAALIEGFKPVQQDVRETFKMTLNLIQEQQDRDKALINRISSC